MPVEVTWDGMDTALLKRFWEAHPEERATLADISDRVIFFHRGITQVHAYNIVLCRLEHLQIEKFLGLYILSTVLRTNPETFQFSGFVHSFYSVKCDSQHNFWVAEKSKGGLQGVSENVSCFIWRYFKLLCE